MNRQRLLRKNEESFRGPLRTAVFPALLALACLLALSGCGGPPESASEPTPPSAVETPAAPPAEPPAVEEEILTPADAADIRAELTDAISALRQPRRMDVAAAGLENPELDVQNLYHEITALRPELKYAYRMAAEYEDGILTCAVEYMPYQTGEFPAGFAGTAVSSLEELLSAAMQNVGETAVQIYITNKDLEPDIMNRALQQVGGGYLYCALSADATEIVYSAPHGMEPAACLEGMARAEALADEVYAGTAGDAATQRERAEALYGYLTETVAYDRRYYSDKASMPYESQTALGALRDGVAICGGYANALDLLFERAGIPCYNVSGKARGENHMWNLACLDGEWLWFDATADRGLSPERGFRHFAVSELDAQAYTWDDPAVRALTGE